MLYKLLKQSNTRP